MGTGIDCALDCTKTAGWIRANGNEFVGRYYRNSVSKYAPLTSSEARSLSGAGLLIVALWESASNTLDHFSHSMGVDEGTSAYKQAMTTCQPAGSPIYFAVDFDCSNQGISGAVNDYFQGVIDGFNVIGANKPAYSIGVYGSGNTCAWLLSHKRVTYSWLAQSTKWGGYDTFAEWNIKQGPAKAKPFDHDNNQSKDGYGGFVVK